MRALYADICSLPVEAIVNPAHADLLGGGGLDGAIHEAAGPRLLEACRALHGCPVGEARITPGFDLPARWVIHTVGPVWRGGREGEETLLASCYRRSLEHAARVNARSIAFPGISTGLHRFPIALAARIAVREVDLFVARSACPAVVLFACFDHQALEVYQGLLP
jgi:O-acetyl-ADP-ribose deacetylase (regulator of RNase III)